MGEKKTSGSTQITYALDLDTVDDDVADFRIYEGDLLAPRVVIPKEDWIKAKRPNMVMVTVGFSGIEDLMKAMSEQSSERL